MRPESVSRARRFRSVRMSDACWYRKSRLFSRALFNTSSSFAGMRGLKRTGATGPRSRISLKMMPEVSPGNGSVPVDIS